MKKKRFTEEHIIWILRDAEAKTIDAATRQRRFGTIHLSLDTPIGQMEVAEVRKPWRRGQQVNFKRLHRVVVPMQVESAQSEVSKESGHGNYPPAHRHNEECGVELEFFVGCHDGGGCFRWLTVKAETTYFCLAIDVGGSFSH